MLTAGLLRIAACRIILLLIHSPSLLSIVVQPATWPKVMDRDRRTKQILCYMPLAKLRDSTRITLLTFSLDSRCCDLVVVTTALAAADILHAQAAAR